LPRVLLVDNYFAEGRVKQLEKSLSSNGATVTVIKNAESSAEKFNRFEGVVLSGSPAMLSEKGSEEKYSSQIRAIRDSAVPILGICFGHQLMGRAFDARVIKGPEGIEKYVETEVLVKDPLFEGLANRINVYESHYEEVESLPEGFILTARSACSSIAAMRHRSLPLVGVQFHPEHNSPEKPDGDRFVGNFVKSLG
jgi:GMP synthase (glutamine-hydrolysing) A subunit